jgi:hypothetical protein
MGIKIQDKGAKWKARKISFNQSLLYKDTFPHSQPDFYLSLFNSVAKKLIIWKIYWGVLATPPSPPKLYLWV